MEQFNDSPNNMEGVRKGRVLLVRNLGKNATELDVQQLFHMFAEGIEPKIFLRTATGQAFVELATESMAAAALKFFHQTPIAVKGSIVQVSLSKRGSVTTYEEKTEAFRVLLVSVTKMQYNVDISTLNGLFSRFGVVEKIITFAKTPAMYQALIQFRDSCDAKEAMVNLHNRNMYEGCNMLQVQPSKLSEINVKSNDRLKAWDFTLEPTIGAVPFSSSESTSFGGTLSSAAMAQMSQQSQGSPFDLGRTVVQTDMGGPGTQTSVVICYNLNADEITPQKLFNLFSLYGSVLRVKILRDKPDTALIQFTNPGYAHLARTHLHESTMYGRPIQVAASRNAEIKVSTSGNDSEEYTKRTMEFSPRDQRYKLEETDKYTKSACRPTKTLFVANIPEGITNDDLLGLFSRTGTVTGVQFKSPKPGSNKQMAIIGVNDESEAIAGVCTFHNYVLSDCGLKVAFSRSVVH